MLPAAFSRKTYQTANEAKQSRNSIGTDMDPVSTPLPNGTWRYSGENGDYFGTRANGAINLDLVLEDQASWSRCSVIINAHASSSS